jgi:hypothetical protein
MHEQFQFLSPHGPCIMCSATGAYPRESIVGSGISGDIHEFIVSDAISIPFLSIHSNICTCGSPLF